MRDEANKHLPIVWIFIALTICVDLTLRRLHVEYLPVVRFLSSNAAA
jgi:hypothetical protein